MVSHLGLWARGQADRGRVLADGPCPRPHRANCDEEADLTCGILVALSSGVTEFRSPTEGDGSRVNSTLFTRTAQSSLEQHSRYVNKPLVTASQEQHTRYSTLVTALDGIAPTSSRRHQRKTPSGASLTTRLKTIAFSPLTRGPGTVFRATGGVNHGCLRQGRRWQRVAPELRGLVICTGRVS